MPLEPLAPLAPLEPPAPSVENPSDGSEAPEAQATTDSEITHRAKAPNGDKQRIKRG